MKFKKQKRAGIWAALAVFAFQSATVAQTRPTWTGKLAPKAASFNDFMRRHVNKTVNLNVTFSSPQEAEKYASGAEPYTSLGGNTGPIFVVGGNLYRVENGGNERTWRTLMGYDKNRRQLMGTFGVYGGHKSAEDPGYIFDLRWRPSYARDVKVFVEDEKGRILLRSSGITLRGGHIQVPSSVYKIIGFDVRRDIENGKVSLGTPERFNAKSPDTTTFDIVYNSVTHDPNDSETKLFEDFRPPVALLQNGEFFLAPSLVQRRFDGKLSTKWNPQTRTLRLRRSQKFADYRNHMFDHT